MWQLYKELHIERLDKELPVIDNYVKFLEGCSKKNLLGIMGIGGKKDDAEFFILFIEFAKKNNLPAFIKFIEDITNGNGK